MRQVMIAGVGMTQFGKHLDTSIRNMATQAVNEAMKDAGVEPQEVGIIFFANAAAGLLTGQEMICGQVALRNTPLMGKPIVNVENACASASTAAYLAWLSVASGQTEVAIAIGAEKMSHQEKMAPFRALISAMDLEQIREETGTDDPLTIAMCSPIGDGSAALVFCSEEYAKRKGCDAVQVRTITLVSGIPGGPSCNQRATEIAYEAAGIGPREVSVAELHDAAAPAEMFYIEELGLCGAGEGPQMIRTGQTDLGGRIPCNTSGGLVAKGHPVGATGCAQIIELVEQLRGRAGKRQVEGAKVGLAQNGGGWLVDDTAATTLTILSR